MVTTGKAVTIRCATPGASIGYILKHGARQANSWRVYGGETVPLQVGDSLRVVAQRIGYLPSREVKRME